ncbi:ribonuclease J [Caldilinea sp.]|uniref:ribonuclease J n=1 Tax=Caldilinea sp. TaxID=2293560 RepID=UPI002B54D687|nr:ribonuclease J [Caldilinea sp.]
MAKQEKKPNSTAAPLLRIIPLGGLGEIGKNMLVLEAGDNLLIVDAGLMFPTSEMHGIDIVIPDAAYVIDRVDKVRGVVLTHGHEDHIGALSYFVEQGLRAPIYATALTQGLLEVKLREQKLLAEAELRTITADDVVELSPFNIEFFHTTHSFPDSVGVCIMTPAGRIVHTSDYRFDPTPVDGRPTEEDKLRKWGDAGVLLLLADSTNAEHMGSTASEATLETTLEAVMGEAPGRVLLATFASNLGRVQQVINVARRHGRRVGMVGRSMVNNVRIAIKLGYLDIKEDELLTAGEMESLPGHEVVIIATGSQGEPTSAMVRMSMGDHRQLVLREGDTVVLSATPIPGNEELFNRTVDNLFRQGANVLYHELGNVHVSGHGGQEDYLRMFDLTRPQYFIPVHGEYRHLVLHARLAQRWGIPQDHVFILEDGETVEFGRFSGKDEVEARNGEKIEAGHVYVDGLGVGDIGNVVLRDRRQLSQEGFIVCIVAVDEYDGEIIYGPEIISRGFVYMREQEDLIRRAQEAVSKVIKKKMPASILENKIKDALGNFASREIGRRPMVLPLVIEM